MKIHYGVMHVPTYERKFTLQKALDRLPELTAVYQDALPPNNKGSWNGARWALEDAISCGADYVCVLQDDCLPCVGFDKQLRRVLTAVPKEAVCLYSNNIRVFEARQHGYSWYTSLNGAVQMTLPVWLAKEFLEFVDAYHPNAGKYPEDTNLDLFCMATRRLIWTTAVSLIDHQNAPSLQGHENHDFRRPAIPPYEDMDQVDWETPALFVGRRFNTHANFRELTDAAHSKFDLWKTYYSLERHEPIGDRGGDAPAGGV